MESADNICLVCHEHIEFYAVGRCDHPICFKCSTRMRALCDQFYCPICRTDLPEVFFLKTKEKFGEMPVRKFITNRKLKIQFENEAIREKFDKLLEHKCNKCPERYPEKNFKALRDHMRRVHTLFYCDLCLELKIFTSERKVYNRQDLATHRRVGDKDDKSYKGHPLCQFCEERYLDKDELYKHLRKDHFYCHFCESLGSQEFYDDYNTLREHFLTDHYLCEEGDCASAQFTNAFRSDIDLKGHQAQVHSKAQTKQQARQERTLNIDINLVPRPNSRPQRGREPRGDPEDRRRVGPRHQGNRGGRNERYNPPSNREKQDIERAIQASLSTITDEDMKKGKNKPNVDSSTSSDEEFAHTEENFPVLGAKSQVPVESTSARTQTPVSTVTSSAISNSTSESKTSLADRLAISNSMSVQHGGLNDFPSLLQSEPRRDGPNNVRPPNKGRGSNFNVKKPEEEFPELPSSSKSNEPKLASWTQIGKSPSEQTKKSNQKKKASSNHWTVPSTYDVNDFPTLGAPSNKNQTERWFKSSDPSSKGRNLNNKSNISNYNGNNDITNNVEVTTKDILDRFSPVNVPDSPKSEKTKNKKKKKKDKVTEIKSEENGNGKPLKGNSSLDDIASMLMKSDDKKETESKKEGDLRKIDNSVTDRAKSKKIVDKIEKRMEKEKGVPRIEELTISESEDVIQPEPVKFSIADDEFPGLGTVCPPKKPPPGFKQESKSVQSSAPPGFRKPAGASYNPPPGFASQKATEAYTNDTVQGRPFPMSTDLLNYQYSQPNGFQERNKLLISIIQSFCAKESLQFDDFKNLSGEFRRSDISASEYYKRCGEILGKENFNEIFPELLALLPDINKQQELLSVYMHSECLKKDDKVLKISGKSKNAKGAWTKTQSGFLTCQTCRQVLIRKDYNDHVSQHNLDTDFPSLGSSVTS